jgi:uncharacterized membrane protein
LFRVYFALGFISATLGAEGFEYTVREIDGLPAGATLLNIADVNSSGQIAGGYDIGFKRVGFFWEGGVVTDVGVLSGGDYTFAADINESGAIVGSSGVYFNTSAFVWTRSTGINALQSLSGTRSRRDFATGMNNAGDIVGASAGHAALWRNGIVHDLGSQFAYTTARAIGDGGHIVGTDGDNHGYLAWRWQNGFVPIGSARVNAVNRFGHAVGGSTALIHWPGNVALTTQMLPGYNRSSGADISDDGTMVGLCAMGGYWQDQRATIWRDLRPLDLNDLIPSGSGWVLESAAGLANSGYIVGYGSLGGRRTGFLLTPVPEASSAAGLAMLVCLYYNRKRQT